MIARCNDSNFKLFKYYGGRGIKVCDEWYDFLTWWVYVRTLPNCPYDDTGQRVVRDFTLDRINNDGHYEPGNVRWATDYEQHRGHRRATPVAV